MARGKIRIALGAAVLVSLVSAAAARGDGAPVLGIGIGKVAIGSVDRQFTYETLPSRRSTKVEAISRVTGSILSVAIPGHYTVPIVAYDRTPGGLSANGRTLALMRQRTRFPQSPTPLIILASGTLRVERRVVLPGDFAFDAISPDGHLIYLIQYTSRGTPFDYRVRALNARTGRLDPRPVVDPTEPDEAMRGNPLTRATSADGRWAYTLYDGSGKPFIHALDTETRQARCLDVPPFPGNSPYQNARLQFSNTGRDLFVTLEERTLATLDTQTLRVAVPRPHPAGVDKHAGGSIGIAFPIALAVVLLGAGLLALRSRRSRTAANRSSRESALPH